MRNRELLQKIKNYFVTSKEPPKENLNSEKLPEVPNSPEKFREEPGNSGTNTGKYRFRAQDNGIKVFRNQANGRYVGFIRNDLWDDFVASDDLMPSDSETDQMLAMGVGDGRGRKRKKSWRG